MDDVWVVIGLLLFGSLLFCLCCYKVTNLLYMLYHIDDATESLTGANDLGMGSLPITLALAVEGKQQNGHHQQLTQSSTELTNVASNLGYMNHSSTPNLYPLEKVGKTNSVTSLSVGVQYDPRDVQEQHAQYSRQQRYSSTAVEYIPANGLRRHHHQQKSHFHVSAPDFRGGYHAVSTQ